MAKYEFPLFYDYGIMLLQWMQKTLGTSSYGKNRIHIQYMTPARAFAKFIFPSKNGQPDRPVVTFHLNSMEYVTGENPGGWVKDREWDYKRQRWVEKASLLVYRLVFGLNLYVAEQEDADIILFQLLSSAPKNRKAVEIVNGHWAEFQVTDPRDETNLEPGEYQDKVIRFGLDIMIPRAYIPRSIRATFPAGPIKRIDTTFEHKNSGDTLLGSLTTFVSAPDDPRNFSVTQRDDRTSLYLKWDIPEFDGKDDILGYRIQQSDDNYLFTNLVELHKETSFIHKDLIQGDTKFYRVSAKNREGESDFVSDFSVV